MECETHERIENIKRPLELGEELLVPCLVKRDADKNITCLYPVINHPHNDRENGQPEAHYHVDYRFLKIRETKENGQGFNVIDERVGHKCAQDKSRLEEGIDGELEYHVLPVVSESHNALTLQFFIRNTKLKHKCIHKGRCPHRGYDLSQEKVIDGKITCPMHGLEFNAETGKIKQELLDDLKSYRNRETEYKTKLNKGLSKISKIKDGDTVTIKEYERLKELVSVLYSTFESATNNGYINVEWKRERTADYHSKTLENQPTLKFRVKLS